MLIHFCAENQSGFNGADKISPSIKKVDNDANDQPAMNDDEILRNIEEAANNKETIERKIAHSTFVGLPESGKTSFMKRLLGKKVEEFSPSTGISSSVIIVDINLAKSSDLQSADITDTNSWNPVECEDSFISQIEQAAHLPKHNSIVLESIQSSDSKEVTVASSNEESIHKEVAITNEENIQSSDSKEVTVASSNEESIHKEVAITNEENIQSSDSKEAKQAMDRKQGKPKRSTIKFRETNCYSMIKKRGGFKEFKKDMKKTFSLYLRDAGGQVEFHELLGLLVSGPSLFFFLFDITRELTKECRLEYRINPTESINCYQSSITNEKALLQCLSTVSAMDISGDLKPFVFIVATHMNKLPEDQRNTKTDEMNKHLNSLISNDNDFEDLVQYYDADKKKVMFEVDNISDSDSVFEYIRSRVTDLIKGRKDFTVPFPITYLMFCLDLRARKECILTLEEIRQMAKVYKIIDNEVFELLKFLHSRIGIIQYFNVEHLNNIIVKDPQVLFDKVTELIIQTFSKSGPLTTKEKKNLKEKGIFSLSVFNNTTKGDDKISSEKFLGLLVHLRIVAQFTTADNEEKFFIPCILNHVPEGKMVSSKISSLGIKFPSKHCPKGVFGVLVTQIMNPESDIRNDFCDIKFQLKEEGIFRDQVTFTVEHCGIKHGTMSIKMHPSNFEVIFDPFSSSPSSSDDDDDDDNEVASVQDICSTILFILKESIKKSSKNLHYKEERVKPIICFKCKECPGLHEIIKGKKYQCGVTRPKRIPKEGRNWFDGGKQYYKGGGTLKVVVTETNGVTTP